MWWWSFAAPAVAGAFQGTLEYEVTAVGGAPRAGTPTRIVVEIGKAGTSVELQGGVGPRGRFVVDRASGRTAFVKDDSRTKAWLSDALPAPEIEWMAGAEVVAGYDCRQYRTVSPTPAGPATGFVWVSPKLKAPASVFGAAPVSLVVAKGALPLKVVTGPTGAVLELTAVRVSKGAPPKDHLQIPDDYAEASFP